MSRRESTHALFVASLTTAAAMVALQVVGTASSWLPLHGRLAAATWVGVGGIAGIALRFTRVRPPGGAVTARVGIAAMIAGVGLALAGTGALSAEHALIPAWGRIFQAKEEFFDALIRPGEPAFIPIVLLVTAVGPALCEEFLFRGVLREYLARHVGRAGRVASLGFLFALLHGDITVLVPMTYVGAMLTLTAEFAGGWLAAAAAHFALNAFNAVVWVNVVGDRDPGLWGGLVMVAAGATVASLAIGWIRSTRSHDVS